MTTPNRNFYSDATRRVKLHDDISIMRMEEDIFNLKYFSTDDFQFLKVPFSNDKNAYQANQYYMLIALPKIDRHGNTHTQNSTSILQHKDASLTLQDFDQAVGMLAHNNTNGYQAYIEDTFRKHLAEETKNIKIVFSLPKMKIDSGDLHLVPNFINLGMKEPFSQDDAQFTNLRPPEHTANEPNIYINDVIHQTVFEMKEEGVKAVAATVVMMNFRESSFAPPPVFHQQFTVDHPFYVAIMAEDTNTNVQKLLFLGHINQVH